MDINLTIDAPEDAYKILTNFKDRLTQPEKTEMFNLLINGDICDTILYLIENKEDRNSKFEEKLLNSNQPRLIMNYCTEVLKCRWPEAEPLLFKTPKWAYQYTVMLIGDRSFAAEEAMLYNRPDLFPDVFYSYLEFEPVVASLTSGDTKDMERMIIEGAHKLLEKGYTDGVERLEHYISKGYRTSAWPEAEELLLTVKPRPHYLNSRNDAYINYSKFCLKGRWKAVEDIIAKSPYESFRYMSLKEFSGKWKKGLNSILSDSTTKNWYNKRFLEK